MDAASASGPDREVPARCANSRADVSWHTTNAAVLPEVQREIIDPRSGDHGLCGPSWWRPLALRAHP